MTTEVWHSDGIAVVDGQGKFVGNALNDEQARKIAWEHSDVVREIKRMNERTALCEPARK